MLTKDDLGQIQSMLNSLRSDIMLDTRVLLNQELEDIRIELKRLRNIETEDTLAIGSDVERLKERMIKLEREVAALKR